MSWRYNQLSHSIQTNSETRVKFLAVFFIIFFGLIVARLFDLQVLRGGFYTALAMGQHELYQKLFPERGSIYVAEEKNGQKILYPLVTNQELNLLYAVPSQIQKPKETAEKLIEILGLSEEPKKEDLEKELFADLSPDLEPKLAAEIKASRLEKWRADRKEKEIESLTAILSKEDDPYEPIRHKVSDAQTELIENLNIEGLDFQKETWRFYPEQGVGSQLFGFWGFDDNDRKGKYGLEGYFDHILSGKLGEIHSERDPLGNIIPIGNHSFVEKQDGADLILTIDRAIQYQACQSLNRAVEKFEAKGGSVVVMDPKTGAILAMCGAPDYNADEYNKVDNIEVYNNPVIFNAYEPGSIFKTITMAAALDAGKVEPQTTYEDTGQVAIGQDIIKNFDDKVYGVKTMTEVLEKSINTGAIYAMRQATPAVFANYARAFGFGQKTGIELNQELPGDLSNLDRRGEIYAATASFGQGITVTPIQMVAAVGAIANGGKLMKPYVVSQIAHKDGEVENFYPQEIRQVITSTVAAKLAGMMVSVVENGYGKTAGVKGYRVAGKTGTAQVPRKDGRGYEPASVTIGSFAGFAPFYNPRFVMLVRIDKPARGEAGATVAAPVFGDIAKFILQYYNVPYDR